MLMTMINDDDNNQNTDDDNDDQEITIFQAMHFREPLISKKPIVVDVVKLEYFQSMILL